MAIIATKSGWLSLAALVDEDDQTWTLYVDEQRRNRTIRKDDTHVQVFSSVQEAERWVLFNRQPIARLRAKCLLTCASFFCWRNLKGCDMFLVSDYNFVQPVTVLSETDTHATLECKLTGQRFEHDKSATNSKLFANEQEAHDWNAKQPF